MTVPAGGGRNHGRDDPARQAPGLDDFAGDWQIERIIEDRRAGTEIQLTGQVRMTPDGDDYRYQEEGTLVFSDGRTLAATRRYLWRRDGDGVAVYFDDGRYFHSFDPAAERPSARHWCDPDRYDVDYDLSDWPRWSVRWEVSGPRKEYVTATWFRRV